MRIPCGISNGRVLTDGVPVETTLVDTDKQVLVDELLKLGMDALDLTESVPDRT